MTSDSEANHRLFHALCKSLWGQSCPRPQLLLGHHLTTTQAASKSATASCSCHDHTATATEKCGSGHCLGHGSISTLLFTLQFCRSQRFSAVGKISNKGPFPSSGAFHDAWRCGNHRKYPGARCRFGPTPQQWPLPAPESHALFGCLVVFSTFVSTFCASLVCCQFSQSCQHITGQTWPDLGGLTALAVRLKKAVPDDSELLAPATPPAALPETSTARFKATGPVISLCTQE